LQSNSHTKDRNNQSGGVNSQNNGSKNQFSGSNIIVVSQFIPHSTVTKRMAYDLRMPFFNGNGSQDPKQICLCVKQYGWRSRSKTRMRRQLSWILRLDIERWYGT